MKGLISRPCETDQILSVPARLGNAQVRTDARAGLQSFKDSTPDAVIIDLIMEEVDAGLDLVKELRALNNKVPLYMLSSTGDYLYTTLDATALGLAGVFQKPIKPQILLKLLETKLKGRKPRP